MFTYEVDQQIELRLLEERHAGNLFRLTGGSRESLRQWLPWVESITSPEDSRTLIHRALQQSEWLYDHFVNHKIHGLIKENWKKLIHTPFNTE